MDTVLRMQNLCCKAGNKYILKNIDWEVKKGQHWVVFGMNGSGKTTLLSIAAGYMGHTHGELERIRIELAARVEFRNAVHHLAKRDSSSVVAD